MREMPGRTGMPRTDREVPQAWMTGAIDPIDQRL
jgi:hypothetical protein